MRGFKIVSSQLISYVRIKNVNKGEIGQYLDWVIKINFTWAEGHPVPPHVVAEKDMAPFCLGPHSLNLILRKHQVNSKGHSTKCLLEKYQTYKRQRLGEEMLDITK